MDELGAIARQRMDALAYCPDKSYAEIMHMTQAELEEMLQLRLQLPSSGQQRVDAQERIKEKIKQRKAKNPVDSTSE
jgi:hypothetical protein